MEEEKLKVDVDLHRSLSVLSVNDGSLQKILRSCGDFGRFQCFHFFMMNFISIFCGFASFYYVFAAADVAHRCRLPEEIYPNDSTYSPIDENHREIVDRFFKRNSTDEFDKKCRIFFNRSSVECPNGWIYDRSTFGLTLTEETDLVCRNQLKKSFLATALQSAGFLLLIVGSLADRYGRKRLIVALVLISFVSTVLNQTLIFILPLTKTQKFFIMVFDQFVSGLIPVSFSLVFILMLELTSSSWTSFTANWAMVSYTIGEVFITFSAKISLDWQKLKCLETILMALWLPYLCFMPESPLFLHSKGDKVRLEKVLDRISKSNGREQSQWFSSFENLIKRKNLKDKENPSPENVSEMRRNALKISICALLGFTTLLVYIKLSFGLAEMNSSPFFSILLGALLEAISYVTCSLLISSRLGRKGSLTLMMSLTIVSLCLLPSFRGENSIFLGQIGKFSISGAIGISWTFVPESFPTSIRTSANGIFVASSRIGAIFTPIIETSIDENSKDFLLYSIGLFSTLVLILTLTLPETKNKSMDE